MSLRLQSLDTGRQVDDMGRRERSASASGRGLSGGLLMIN